MSSESSTERKALKDLMTEYEKNLILAALSQCGGNQRRAASVLGVLPTTLHEKLKRLGLISRLVRGWSRSVLPERPSGAE